MEYVFNSQKDSISIIEKKDELLIYKDKNGELHFNMICNSSSVSILFIGSLFIHKDFELYPFFRNLIDDIKDGNPYKITDEDILLARDKESLEKARLLCDSLNNSSKVGFIKSNLFKGNSITLNNDECSNLGEELIISEKGDHIILTISSSSDNLNPYISFKVGKGCSNFNPFNKCFYRMYDEMEKYIISSDNYGNNEAVKRLIME